MSSAKTRPAKAYAYARKHLLLFLFGILIGSAFYVSASAMGQNDAPTKILASQMFNKLNANHETIEIATTVPLKLESAHVKGVGEVMGVNEVKTPIQLTYTVIENDSMTRIAKRAVNDYIEQYGLEMSRERLDYVASVMVLGQNYKRLLKRGDTVSFNEIQIIDALKKGLDKTIISSTSGAIY